jgi:hypothetical protein
MPEQHQKPHVIIQSDRIVLDAHALALATLLITAAAGAVSCDGQTAAPEAGSSGGAGTGGSFGIGPGICAIYSSGGVAGSSSAADSGFLAASGGATNVETDASVGGTSGFQTIPVGGICAVQ